MIPLVAPTYTHIDRAALAAFAFHGNLASDKALLAYEEAFAERVGCGWAVAVSSGTTAIQVALRALQPPGRDVAISTYGCVATVNAIRAAGLSVFLTDGGFDVETALGVQDDPPAGIATRIVTHLFGRPTDVSFDRKIEDYTLSLGGVPELLAPLGVCSTSEGKMLSTWRGGMIFGNDEGLRDMVRQLAYYDWPGESARLGAYSYGMSPSQAVLGLSQLQQLDSFIERRQEIARVYTARFQYEGIECPNLGTGSVFFRYLVGTSADAPEDVVEALTDDGIEAGRGVWPPLHQLDAIAMTRLSEMFPLATSACARLVSVPCHPELTDSQVGYICNAVVAACAP